MRRDDGDRRDRLLLRPFPHLRLLAAPLQNAERGNEHRRQNGEHADPGAGYAAARGFGGGGVCVRAGHRWSPVAMVARALARAGRPAAARAPFARAANAGRLNTVGHEEQRCDRRHQQAADHGAPERGILLAAFAERKRHRQHADDHGERGHQHRPKAREAGFRVRRPPRRAPAPGLRARSSPAGWSLPSRCPCT